MIFDKTVKNITRIGEVINILMRYGFEDVVANTALKRFVPAKKQIAGYAEKSPYDYSRWERIRMVIEELGTTFIKLAQLLSNRPDILPASLIKEFSKLQSSVPPFHSKVAKKILEKELGKPLDEVFSYFDNRTIGAGSIGQVHRARLIRGEDVVVKIQRPEAAHKVRTDLRLLREFVKLTENYFRNIGIINPIEIVDTFEESMIKELNYKEEALNMMRFRKMYEKDTDFYVPKPYRNLSTSKVLIIEFIPGCEVTDIEQLHAWGLDTKEVIEKVMAIYLKQIFDKGFFHADPHPGNILIKPDMQIMLIDFGMTGKITKRQKYDFSGVAVSIYNQNTKGLASNLRRLAVNGEVQNMQAFENDLENLIDEFTILDTEEAGISELIARLRKIIYDYKLRIPGEIFLILRALAILEGIGHKLHPDFKIVEFMMPYGKKIVTEQFSPTNIKNELTSSLSQFLSLLHSSPVDIKYILKKVRKGQLQVNIEHKGYEPILKQKEIITNKIIFTVMISALIIASSIVLAIEPQNMTKLLGMPIISTIGYFTAIFLSVLLFLYTFRNRYKP